MNRTFANKTLLAVAIALLSAGTQVPVALGATGGASVPGGASGKPTTPRGAQIATWLDPAFMARRQLADRP